VEELPSADGAVLAVRRAGRGEPVILVHGSAGGLDSWDPVLPMITPAFEAWVYARRGYPPSGSVASPKLFAHDVADLSAVIAAAGGSAHVIGASYGASVVLHALLDGLAGIRSAVLFEPPLYAAGSALEPVLAEYSHLIEVGDAPGAARHFAEKVARYRSRSWTRSALRNPTPTS
jgi:pimeloyl-ACP methyl ester carboxylesterase